MGYLIDLTNQRWAWVEPIFPSQEGRGRRRTVSLRHVIDALRYQDRTGCQWRLIPLDFPPSGTARYDFDDIGRPDVFPVQLREGIEGQAHLPVPLHVGDHRWIARAVLLDKGRGELIGLRAALLIEDHAQLLAHQLALLLRYVTEHIVHFVLDTALGCRELKRNRVQHGLVSVGDPQANLLDAARLDVGEQVFPGTLVLAFAGGKSDDLALPLSRDANQRQNRYLLARTCK